MQAHTQNQAAAVAGPLNLWTAALRENPASQLVPLNNLRRVYPAEIKLRPLTMAMGGMVLPVWTPQPARRFVEGRSIKDLHFSSDKDFNHLSPPSRPWFGRCNIGGEDLKCFVKTHRTPSRQKEFMNEIGLHQAHLFPLHGTCVLPIYGVWGLMESVHIVTELPHHTFWMTAHPDMPDILKKRVIEAVTQIHSYGVVHGSLDLYDILIGADARVSIVNFDFARVVDPINNAVIGVASAEEMKKEMKKVQCMLDYPTGIANRETERYTRLSNHRKSRHLDLKAGPRHQDTLPVSGEVNEDFLDNPPIPSDEYDVQGYNPMRYIVPGKEAQEFANALKAFEALIGKLEQEDLLTNGLPSPAVSPRPEAVPIPEGVKVEVTEGRDFEAPVHRYPTRRKRKEAPTQPVTRPTKRTRSVAATASQAAAGPSSQPLASTTRRAGSKVVKPQLSSACQSDPPAPLRHILKVKKEPLIHESVLENNARTDRPPVIIRDFGFTSPAPIGNQNCRRMQPREQVLHHIRTQRLSGVSEKAKGKRKASSDEEIEEEGGSTEPGPSSRKKPRLVHTAEGINPASVRFNDAPDVYFNQHEVPKDNWWHFPKLKRPSRRPQATPRAFPTLQQKLARRTSLDGPQQPAPLMRSDSLVAHTGRSPEPPSRHDSMEVHTGATPPPPSPSGSFDIDYIELDGGSFYEVRPRRRRRRREVPPAPVPQPAPYPFTFTFPHGSALRAVYDWVGATLGLN
ncbi:hypothetical protein BKA70DRAFT_326529 [Coprinopsis sp. MPI-PUGE-AT-0042]|nr:hypothetical protein BKA70DRAFT_326529 [Coprinopsis sp. MPI-PUGE-AT-0042]